MAFGMESHNINRINHSILYAIRSYFFIIIIFKSELLCAFLKLPSYRKLMESSVTKARSKTKNEIDPDKNHVKQKGISTKIK